MEKVTPNNPPLLPAQIAMKEYIAMITQEDLDAPTYTVFKNTLGQIAWSRQTTGKYLGTLTGAFPADHTWLIISTVKQPNADDISKITQFIRQDDNIVRIWTSDGANYADNILIGQMIEIRVYTPQ